MGLMPSHLNPKLGQLDNGTVLRHVYKRGEYSGDEVTATVQGERINVSGDASPDSSVDGTRTPSGAAREADRLHRGVDARDDPYGYSGWDWWKYQNEDGEWVPIRELPEWTRP
jgi:hypothetical protein